MLRRGALAVFNLNRRPMMGVDCEVCGGAKVGGYPCDFCELTNERDDLLKALVKSQYVLVNLREHARHIRTCDAPELPCTCELDDLLEQSIEVVHGSSDLIVKAGGQEQPHYPRQKGGP